MNDSKSQNRPDATEISLQVEADALIICELRREEEMLIVDLIRRNLDSFEEAGSVLASAFRRLERFYETYMQPGSVYLVVHDPATGACIGGAGLGPLAGLSPAEGIGEVRELVLEASFRHRGIGTLILGNCLQRARELGYHRLYLETTPEMQPAQQLFRRYGFRPVIGSHQRRQRDNEPELVPCYFVLEELGPQSAS